MATPDRFGESADLPALSAKFYKVIDIDVGEGEDGTVVVVVLYAVSRQHERAIAGKKADPSIERVVLSVATAKAWLVELHALNVKLDARSENDL